MDDILSGWKYGSSVDPQRQSELAALGSFEALRQAVATDVQRVQCVVEQGEHVSLRRYKRAVFRFELPQHGDALYNGPYGMRAQFWLDAQHGRVSEQMLLATLVPELVRQTGVDTSMPLQSINPHSPQQLRWVRLWIDEQARTRDQDARLAIARWEAAEASGIADAYDGLRAPRVTHFKVIGLWVILAGRAYVLPDKRQRHRDLHLYGFA